MQPCANTFNSGVLTGAGDHPILQGSNDGSWRVRQLNIQNKDQTNATEITVKNGSNTTFGPITVSPLQLLTLELNSEEDQHILIVPKGQDLVLNSSANVDMIAFGYAGLA